MFLDPDKLDAVREIVDTECMQFALEGTLSRSACSPARRQGRRYPMRPGKGAARVLAGSAYEARGATP